MALGMTTDRVVRRIMAQGLRQVMLGCVIGPPGAGGAFLLIRRVVYGTGSLTALTFVIAPLVLLAVATVALLIPALRASRLDPQIALRQD